MNPISYWTDVRHWKICQWNSTRKNSTKRTSGFCALRGLESWVLDCESRTLRSILARLPLVFWSLIPWGPLLPQVLRHHDHLSGSIRAALPGIGLWHNSVEISRYLRGKLQMRRHQSYGFATLFWLKWHLQYLQAGQPSMVLVSVDSSKLSHV